MLSSILPTFKHIRCKLTELLCNQLLEIASFLQYPVRTQGAAVCRRRKIARRTFDRLKTLYLGRKDSNISGIQSWSAEKNVDNGGNLKTAEYEKTTHSLRNLAKRSL